MAFHPNAEQNIKIGEKTRRAYGLTERDADLMHGQEVSIPELLSKLKDTSFLPAESSSDSVIITGKLISNPKISIFLKIFEDWSAFENPAIYIREGLRAEYNIYNQMFKLRYMGVTPNVLARVGTYSLTTTNDTKLFLYEPAIQAISNYSNYFLGAYDQAIRPRKETLPRVSKWERTKCIMTSSVEFSLHSILMDYWLKPTREDMVGILYQIVHLMTWFEYIQMVHHDLHEGNIRVEYHAEPISLYYQHKAGQCVRLRTKYVVKIYDFDRSTIYKNTDLGQGIVVKQVLNSMTGFGVFNAKEDIFKLFFNLYKYDPKDEWKLSTLMIKLIPLHLIRISKKFTMGDLYKNLPSEEVPLYEAIMNSNKKCEAENSQILQETFDDYRKKLNEQNIISVPPDQHWSVCSIYIPNSLMLPHLEMLDVLCAEIPAMTANSLESIEQRARVSGQSIYPTPNIFFTEQANTKFKRSLNFRKLQRTEAQDKQEEEEMAAAIAAHEARAAAAAKAKSSWFGWIPTILPTWWWRQEEARTEETQSPPSS